MKILHKSVNISGKKLRRLPQTPDGKWLFKGVKVVGDFHCGFNLLSDLTGSPDVVDGDFICMSNPYMTSLRGAPKIINGNFNCMYNPALESLFGFPEKIDGDVFMTNKRFSISDIRKRSVIRGKIYNEEI